MVTWELVRDYLRSEFTAEDDDDDILSFDFQVNGGRSQIVFIHPEIVPSHPDELWLRIASPIGTLNSFQLLAALEKVQDTVCGGLTKLDNTIFASYIVRLENMVPEELIRYIEIVTSVADSLEEELLGTDDV